LTTATTTEPLQPAAPAATGARVYSHREVLIVFSGLMLGMLLAALDQTVVATALPTIVGQLGGLDHLAWVVTAYLLTSTASTPLYGKIGDLYGRKRTFQSAIIIFLAGSLLSGAAQNMWQLIGSRAIQGLGAGGLMSLAMAIIGDLVPPRDRGRYQGYNGAVFAFASVAGPLLGGFFVDHLTWRWVFFINLPIGTAALVMSSLVLRETERRLERKVDYVGSALLIAGVTTLLLITTWGGSQYAWTSPVILMMSVLVVSLLGLFVWWEGRQAEPILPPRLFRSNVISLCNISNVFLGVALFGAIVYLPLFLQLVTGASATSSGLLTMPLTIGLIGMSIVCGRVISSTGRYKAFPIVGLAISVVGMFLLSTLTSSSNQLAATLYMVILGVGMGMVMPVLITAIQNAVSLSDLGTATASSQFFRSMGSALGVAVFGSILNNRLAYYLPKFLPLGAVGASTGSVLQGSPAQILALPAPVRHAIVEAFSHSLHVVFLSAIPVLLAGLLAMLFLEEVPLRKSLEYHATAEAVV